jgi:Flp pilus assembly protein TadB
MTVLDLAVAAVCFAGTYLTLASIRWFRRVPLSARLAAHVPRSETLADRSHFQGGGGVGGGGVTWVSGLTRLLGARPDLAARLEAAGRAPDVGGYRLRLTFRAVCFLAAAVGAVVAASPPAPVAVLVLAGMPALSVLLQEQHLDRDRERRAERIDAEMPVVAEQLGVLLSAGLSVRAALHRLASRGQGEVAADLQHVVRAIRAGSSENEALAAWSAASRLESVERVTAVLALHREAADLGELIATEAQSIRAASQRRLVATIERRAQLVWVPVTVATLVPGLILVGVPFVGAVGRVVG